MTAPARPPLPDLTQVLEQLRAWGAPANIAGMMRFGITPSATLLGVSMPRLRGLAKTILKARDKPGQTGLAQALWTSGFHEARVLATLLFDPTGLGPAELNRMAASLDSWDVCDQFCSNLCRWSPHARELALDWSGRPEEFVRRAGFALMACLAVGRVQAPEEFYAPFLERIEQTATDSRNFVAKAVNWALRQIGKRNAELRTQALATAGRILDRSLAQNDRTARWIAKDAIRELHDPKILARIRPAAEPVDQS